MINRRNTRTNNIDLIFWCVQYVWYRWRIAVLPFFGGVMFWLNFGILDISRWLYIQLLTSNPNFRSKMNICYSQEGKHRKNEFRTNRTITLISFLFLFKRELICPSTVGICGIFFAGARTGGWTTKCVGRLFAYLYAQVVFWSRHLVPACHAFRPQVWRATVPSEGAPLGGTTWKI